MENFVISLRSSETRRKHIIEQFQQQSIEFKFFDAIQPDQNRQVAETLGLNISNCDLTPGEVACLLSHVSLWQLMIDHQLQHIAIFEDDILLGEGCREILQRVEWIPQKADIIKLEMFASAARMRWGATTINTSRKLRQLTGKHLGAAGYILSLESAQVLLNYLRKQSQLIAIDHVLFEIFVDNQKLKIYQMLPGLCIQSDRLHPVEKAIASDLEFERRQRFDIYFAQQKKVKRTFAQKVQREFARFINQLGLLMGKMTFK